MTLVDTNAATLVWLRRDLRLHDNSALQAALGHEGPVAVAFVFDRTILDRLESAADRRVEFFWHALAEIDAGLARRGARLIVRDGDPREEIPRLAAELGCARVVAAEDYEPEARQRDGAVAGALQADGRAFVAVQDHVLVSPRELLTGAGTPYTVYTPYRRRWRAHVDDSTWAERRSDPGGRLSRALPPSRLPSLDALGFRPTNLRELPIGPGATGAREQLETFASRIGDYAARRDYPAMAGPSYLSVHLRFGTLSIREAARLAWSRMHADPASRSGAETWLHELVWRDFYFQILYHFPHVAGQPFREEMNGLAWVDDETAFGAWCEGRTGYPLVDAAMAQINQTGYMHNRLRMLVASFLTKDLGIDWRRGEAYFAAHLNDYDLAANNGGWQWAASTGCDAQPYFRIFNPVTQSRKFDPRGRFIRRYLPQLADLEDAEIHAPWEVAPQRLEALGIRLGETYPAPVVDHAAARRAALARFEAVRRR